MTFSCLQKLLEKLILLFYQNKFKFISVRYTMIDGMSPLPKIGSSDEFWAVLILGGWSFLKLHRVDAISHFRLVLFCTYVVTQEFNFFISLNLHFLNFNENFKFSTKFSKFFLWFFFLCNCPEVSSLTVLAWH